MIKQFTSYTQQIGERGEDYAVSHLMYGGFTIVGRNIPNRYGEIDIIAKKRKRYYFYEVKACRKGGWFNPAENMTETKRRKFFVSVEHYCLLHKIRQYHVFLLVVKLGEKELDHVIEELSLA